ncbi:MAG TPA: hypothetical protein VEH05_06880 [Streptosporangiaceae bacterium]|nr:hypothetical protein [Streptosporangiaceae bacterium]
MGYLGQFDNLIREQDRGHAVRFTRSIVVFSDGLAVCPVAVRGAGRAQRRGLLSGLVRRGEVFDDSDQLRLAAEAAADATAAEFAHACPGGAAVPFAVVARVVLSRPRQVSALAVYEHVTGSAAPAASVYLGDLAADRVLEVLGPPLGERLDIDVAGC